MYLNLGLRERAWTFIHELVLNGVNSITTVEGARNVTSDEPTVLQEKNQSMKINTVNDHISQQAQTVNHNN